MRPDTGLPIPSTLAFEYPTLREMGEYLAGELLADGAEPTDHTVSSPDLPADADTDTDDGLSDDEIVDKLLEELEDSGY